MQAFILINICFVFNFLPVHGDVKFQMERALQGGNYSLLAGHCLSTLELTDEKGTVHLNRKQVFEHFGRFFYQNPPKCYQTTENGYHRNQTRYFQGIYESENGKEFRFYFEARQDEVHIQGHEHYRVFRISIEQV